METPHFKLMFEEGYRALLPNPLGQTVEPEMDLLTNSAMTISFFKHQFKMGCFNLIFD
jgi:hypothetical protein